MRWRPRTRLAMWLLSCRPLSTQHMSLLLLLLLPHHVVHALTKQRRGDRGCDVFLSANAPLIRDVAAKLVIDGDASTRGRTAARFVAWWGGDCGNHCCHPTRRSTLRLRGDLA